MSFFVIVRGPLGVGKTAVSKSLSTTLGARYLSIDQILDDHGLWNRGRLSEFLAANEIGAQLARPSIDEGTPVIFDGNFYWKTQIEDLVHRLGAPHYIFTLVAPLRVCIARDRLREAPHGPEAARQVYARTLAFECGVRVDARPPADRVVRELAQRIATLRGPSALRPRRDGRWTRRAGPGPRPSRPPATRRGSAQKLEALRAVIARVPRGRVITYGQVAEAAGLVGAARLTVRALQHADGLPWQRVVAAGGRIALPGEEGREQRLRLQIEGVEFRGDRVRLDRFGWTPRRPRADPPRRSRRGRSVPGRPRGATSTSS